MNLHSLSKTRRGSQFGSHRRSPLRCWPSRKEEEEIQGLGFSNSRTGGDLRLWFTACGGQWMLKALPAPGQRERGLDFQSILSICSNSYHYVS